MNVRQQPVEPLIPAAGRRERVARATERMLPQKRVLETRRERRQHRLRVSVVDGGE
jgi:hypothetical protein